MLLQTKRLLLRPTIEKDKEDFFEIFHDEKTCRYLLYEPWDEQSLDQEFHKKLLQRSMDGDRGMNVSCVLDHKVIGSIAMWYTDMKDTVEIGYIFNKNYSKKGYATEALLAIMQYLFYELKAHRIYANIDVRNDRSIALCKRIGMRKEAHFIKDYFYKGKWSDSYIYAMLIEDYNKNKESFL